MKTVIEMAREVYGQNTEWTDSQLERLKQFEALIRADERHSWPAEMEAMERQVNILTDALAQERKACAKVCDDLPAPDSCSSVEKSLWDVATLECGDAIRARSCV